MKRRHGRLAVVLASLLAASVGAPAWAENHLANQASPYLQLHGTDPVDWYPWGEAAFAAARAQDKPIFLTIGFASCHWCHVMQEESFADPVLAAFLNRHYIAIAIDREELPAVDAFYLAFVERTGGQTGWPLNVILASDRRPLVGTTYLPRQDLLRLLTMLSQRWSDPAGRSRLVEMVAAAGHRAMVPPAAAPGSSPEQATLARLLDQAQVEAARAYDDIDGGFGDRPKFPQADLLTLLERPEIGDQGRTMCKRTLESLVAGTIHDQLHGGFHRYTIDSAWRVPHFEKLLIDQALLASTYLRGADRFATPAFRQVAIEILDFVESSLRLGDLYAAGLDADSATIPAAGDVSTADPLATSPRAQGSTAGGEVASTEGAYYLWRTTQISQALAGLHERAAMADRLLSMVFGLHPEGNVAPALDGRGTLAGLNVLYVARQPESCAVDLGLSGATCRDLFEQARRALAAQRRPPPRIDSQILVGWNARLITAQAEAALGSGRSDELMRAQRGARAIRATAWDPRRGLAHLATVAGGASSVVPASTSDYAALEQALLTLHEVDGDVSWLEWAVLLQDQVDQRCWDEASGTYFDGPATDLPERLRTDQDGGEGCANSLEAAVLVRLTRMTGDARLTQRLSRLLDAYRRILAGHPQDMPVMLGAMAAAATPDRRVVLVGEPGDPRLAMLLVASRRTGDADLVRVCLPAALDAHSPLRGYPELAVAMVAGSPTASYCSPTGCRPPTNDPERLAHLLAEP